MTAAWFVVCCGEALVVVGWWLAGIGSTTPASRPAPPSEPAVVWSVEGEGRGTPVVWGSTVYFLSKRHEVVAVDIGTGRVRWRRGTGEPGEATAGSALVAASAVVMADDYNVVAFDSDGAERWRFEPADGYGPGMYLGGASDDAVFAGSPSGHLYAIDAASGVARWSTRAADDGRTTVFAPVFDRGLVLAGFTSLAAPSRGGLLAVDAASGCERWRRVFPNPGDGGAGTRFAGGPLVVDDLVLAASRDGSVHAFDRVSGRNRWVLLTHAADDAPRYDFRALARTGKTLFAGSLTGVVVAYDLETRRERWRRRPIDASVGFGIASDDRAVYVPYLSGQLVALGVTDGAERWRTTGGTRGFIWTPVPTGDRLLTAGSGAGFFAFRRW